MKTIIFDSINDRIQSINSAVEFLKKSEIVAFPTETVYGIGARIFDISAVLKIYELKGRNLKNPLSAHISNLNHTEILCSEIPDDFYKIANAFLPGPISVVLKKHKSISDEVTGGLNTISIRMPDNEICLDLINSVGQPLAGTSANLSGKPSSTSVSSVLDDFDGKIPAILDAGNSKYSIESTVLSLAEHQPTIIRPGAIPQQDIEKVLNKKILSSYQGISLFNKTKFAYKSNFTIPKKIFESYDDMANYILSNQDKRLFVLANRIDQYQNAEFKILNQRDYFENLRIAEKAKFDEIILLVDENIKKDEALFYRITELI